MELESSLGAIFREFIGSHIHMDGAYTGSYYDSIAIVMG